MGCRRSGGLLGAGCESRGASCLQAASRASVALSIVVLSLGMLPSGPPCADPQRGAQPAATPQGAARRGQRYTAPAQEAPQEGGPS